MLDAQGYRVDKQGNRIGEVDIQAKTANEKSNAVAGFYISSQGAQRARRRHGAERRAQGLAPATGRAAALRCRRPGTAPAASGQPVPLAPPR